MRQPTLHYLLLCSAAFCMPSAAFAEDAAPDRNYLPGEIVVTGAVDGYSADDGSTATKTPTPLIDVPQTVGVITDDQLQDQAITQLGEALRYVPGISLESGEGNRDAVFIRGQETTADFYLDGLRDDAQYYRSLYNIERIEVLKGANALIFGRGGGGGVINRVSKTAQAGKAFGEFDASANTFGAFNIAADVNQPLSDVISARLNATYEEFGNNRDFYDGRFIGISPTLSAQIGPDTRLTATYTYDDDRRLADRGIPSLNGLPLQGYDDTLFGDPDFNLSDTQTHIARSRIDHRLSDNLAFNASVQYAAYDKVYANILPRSTDGVTTSLSGYRNETSRENLIGQANLVWNADTGGIGHIVLVGIEVSTQDTTDSRRTAQFAVGTGFQTTATVGLADVLDLPAISLTDPIRSRDSRLNVPSAYIQDQISVGDHLQLVGGLRWDRFDLETIDFVSGDPALSRVDEKVSPRAALIVKPNDTLSFYASYATSFLPQSGDQFTNLTDQTAALKPEKFTNYELGAKWLIQPDLFLTAAIFRLDRSNSLAPDPGNSGMVILTGATRTEGLELNLVGNILPGWEANLGYTYLDGKIRTTTSAAAAGTRLEQVPKHQLSAWNHIDLTDRLSIGLGAIYQAEQFASTSNAVVLPDYWRFDAAAYYEVSDRLSLQVNFENLFDETYYPSAHGDNNIQPGTPFSARVGVRVKL